PVTVEGWSEMGYVHPDHMPLVKRSVSRALASTRTTLLSPFDPVVRFRPMAHELFGFEYGIETYTPAVKRRYGYFVLPILHNGRLVGRLDPKAHRQSELFEVKAIYLERDVAITDELVFTLAMTLRECATWHRTPDVAIRWSDPPELAERLREALSR